MDLGFVMTFWVLRHVHGRRFRGAMKGYMFGFGIAFRMKAKFNDPEKDIDCIVHVGAVLQKIYGLYSPHMSWIPESI